MAGRNKSDSSLIVAPDAADASAPPAPAADGTGYNPDAAEQLFDFSGWDADKEAVKAMDMLNQHIEIIDKVMHLAVGVYINKPPGFEAWTCVRCGLKGSPVAESLRMRLKKMGYRDAHPAVRMVGAESDGDRAMIVWAPPQVERDLKTAKSRLKRTRRHRIQKTMGGHIGMLGDMPGVVVDDLDANFGRRAVRPAK